MVEHEIDMSPSPTTPEKVESVFQVVRLPRCLWLQTKVTDFVGASDGNALHVVPSLVSSFLSIPTLPTIQGPLLRVKSLTRLAGTDYDGILDVVPSVEAWSLGL